MNCSNLCFTVLLILKMLCNRGSLDIHVHSWTVNIHVGPITSTYHNWPHKYVSDVSNNGFTVDLQKQNIGNSNLCNETAQNIFSILIHPYLFLRCFIVNTWFLFSMRRKSVKIHINHCLPCVEIILKTKAQKWYIWKDLIFHSLKLEKNRKKWLWALALNCNF